MKNDMGEINKSIEQIKENYKFYEESGYREIWSLDNPANIYLMDKLKEELSLILTDFELKVKKILDVACGNGWLLNFFYQKGAKKQNLYGMDINKGRIDMAKSKYVFNLKVAEASKLPFEDDFFDLVSVFTLFSSVISLKHRKLIANEVLRVLKKDGIIILYDIRFNNPFN